MISHNEDMQIILSEYIIKKKKFSVEKVVFETCTIFKKRFCKKLESLLPCLVFCLKNLFFFFGRGVLYNQLILGNSLVNLH